MNTKNPFPLPVPHFFSRESISRRTHSSIPIPEPEPEYSIENLIDSMNMLKYVTDRGRDITSIAECSRRVRRDTVQACIRIDRMTKWHLAQWMLMAILIAISMVPAARAQTPARIRLNVASANIFPAGWTVVPVPESTFLTLRNRNTETAYTDLVGKVTFVREHYILTAPSKRLRHTLLHEGGHVACDCNSEQTAEKWAGEHTP